MSSATNPMVLFTKLFGQRDPGEIGRVAAELGFDGIDLLIRPGCTIDPAEASRIPQLVKEFRASGLSVPMATTDLTDVNAFPVDGVFGACAEAGIGLIRLGYWTYDGTRRYADLRAEARAHLAELAGAAGRFGVRLAIQLHGGTIHSSGALTSALLEGHDPALLGAYPDPGNQAVQDGREDWRLTFDVLEPWLACVGVKNGGWARQATGWESEWLGLADGMVPWPAILTHLRRTGFTGPLSFHSHYTWPYDKVLEQTGADLTYVRDLLGSSR
ncbi:sugar phosphate isomerase/epimerase family protein [Flindersiella endophytica]